MTWKVHRLILFGCVLVALCGAQRPAEEGAKSLMGYELYSWPHGADWNFSLLPNTSSEKTAGQVFAKKSSILGVRALKAKISTLPKGSTIFWVDRIPSGTGPKTKAGDSLVYPPTAIIKGIVEYAASQGIKVEVLPS